MKYYICEFCGKSKSTVSNHIKYHPNCGCKEGGGKTFMKSHSRDAFKQWCKNKRKNR